MPLFLISPDHIQGNKAVLDETESHHIVHVLRKKVGETISLSNGRGDSFEGKIIEAKERVVLEIIEAQKQDSADLPELILCPALLKNPRMDWLIEKAVELGVHSVLPFVSARAVVKFRSETEKQSKIKRWERIAAAAVKQSGRKWLPPIGPLLSFDELLKRTKGLQGPRIFFTPESKEKIGAGGILLKERPPFCIIMIGPEGGFTIKELEKAQEAGFTPYSLGPFILRGETASIAALSILNFLKTPHDK